MSAPLLTLAAVILIARLAMLNARPADRRVNIALLAIFVCAALRDRATHIFLTWLTSKDVDEQLLYQLSEVAVIPFAAGIFLLCTTWLRQGEPTWLAAFVWTAGGVCIAVILAMLRTANPAPAAAYGLHNGWAVIATSGSQWAVAAAILFHDSLNYVFSLTLAFLCLRELRARPDRRGLVVCMAIAVIAVGAFVETVLVTVATLALASNRHPDFVQGLAGADRQTPALYMLLFGLIAAAPLFKRLLQRHGWDRMSRLRQRLGPIWTDLTMACPEIVHPPPGRLVIDDPHYRLHRTVVELRDCMLILARYVSDEIRTMSDEVKDDFELKYTVCLALAWRAKMDGYPPSADVSARPSAASELLDDALELSRIAAKWPSAKKLAAKSSMPPSDESVSGVPEFK